MCKKSGNDDRAYQMFCCCWAKIIFMIIVHIYFTNSVFPILEIACTNRQRLTSHPTARTKCFKIFTKNWKLFMVFLVINVITIQLIQYFDKFCSTMTMNCTVEWTLEKCQKTFQTFLNTLLFKATFLFFWNKETILAFGLVLGNFRCWTIFC